MTGDLDGLPPFEDDGEHFQRIYFRPPLTLDPDTAVPMKHAPPPSVEVEGDSSIQSQHAAQQTALALLDDATWWNARARWSGAVWRVSYERRTSPREERKV